MMRSGLHIRYFPLRCPFRDWQVERDQQVTGRRILHSSPSQLYILRLSGGREKTLTGYDFSHLHSPAACQQTQKYAPLRGIYARDVHAFGCVILSVYDTRDASRAITALNAEAQYEPAFGYRVLTASFVQRDQLITVRYAYAPCAWAE